MSIRFRFDVDSISIRRRFDFDSTKPLESVKNRVRGVTFGAILGPREGLGKHCVCRQKRNIKKPQKTPHFEVILESVWAPGGVANSSDFFYEFRTGILCSFEPFRRPKGCQKCANGTTLGPHLRDKRKSENGAPARTGASFSGSEGVPRGIGWVTLGAHFSRTRSEGTFFRIWRNLGALWVPIGGPPGSLLGDFSGPFFESDF